MADTPKKLSRTHGALPDDQNVMTAGPRGPLRVQDWQPFFP
jgi:catalase